MQVYLPKEAFVNCETEFIEDAKPYQPKLSLIPDYQIPEAATFPDCQIPDDVALFEKASFNPVSLPSRPSWEANNLCEELTHTSHLMVNPRLTGSASTMDLDSLSVRLNQDPEDSLDFNLQEAIDEEDSLIEQDLEHDSLQIKEPVKPTKKKLVIPYNESFSSTNSIFTTSQDGSLDSCCNKNQDSLNQSNMVPIKPWLNELTGQPKLVNLQVQQPKLVNPRVFNPNQPLIIGQDYQPMCKPVKPVVSSQSAVATQPVEPVSSPSLMRLATERMKRKFLGWN